MHFPFMSAVTFLNAHLDHPEVRASFIGFFTGDGFRYRHPRADVNLCHHIMHFGVLKMGVYLGHSR